MGASHRLKKYIQHGRAVACCRRTNQRKQNCYRLIPNWIQYHTVGTGLAPVRKKNYILNQIDGQPQGLSLRLCEYFNSYAVKWGITKLKHPLNLHKLRAFARRYNAHQGKPRPYFLPAHFPDVYPFLLRRKRILCNQKRRKP